MISVILCTIRPEFKKNIFNNFFKQDFTDKELIIILNNDKMNLEDWKTETKEYKNVHVYKLSEKTTLGECLNFGISKSSFNIIAKFDDDDFYSEVYLAEAYQAMVSNKADIVGKCTSYIYFEAFQELMIFRPGNENQFKPVLKGGTLVFKKHVWDHIKFENRAVSSDHYFLKAAKHKKFKLFSTSKENYLCIRRRDLSSHTQKLSSNKYRNRCKLVAKADNIFSFFDINDIPSLQVKRHENSNKNKVYKRTRKKRK